MELDPVIVFKCVLARGLAGRCGGCG